MTEGNFLLPHKRAAAPCYLCGATAHTKGTTDDGGPLWVTCSDLRCGNGKHWQTFVTWPRCFVIDWREAWPVLILGALGVCASGVLVWCILVLALGV